MPTPHSTWQQGYLDRSRPDIIRIPKWIETMVDQQARPFAETCFREGYFTGWANSSDQYVRDKVVRAVAYILRQNGATPDEITVITTALEGILPERIRYKDGDNPRRGQRRP